MSLDRPNENLSDAVLGYAHPRASEFDANAESVFECNHRISHAPAGSSLFCEHVLRNKRKFDALNPNNLCYEWIQQVETSQKKFDELKAFVDGGVFVDCGSGINPANDVADFLNIPDRIFIDSYFLDEEAIGTHVEKIEGPVRELFIIDDITRTLSQIFEKSVHLLHMRNMYSFEGNPDLFWEEAHRVLHDGGYIIMDGDIQHFFESSAWSEFFELDLHRSQLKIFKKKKSDV